MTSELPCRTAMDVGLPDGTTVWVKTLNVVENREAGAEADIRAAQYVRRLRESGELYEDVLADFEEMGAEEQAKFVVQSQYSVGEWQEKAREKHPDPLRPEHTEGISDDAWIAAVGEWEAAVAEAETQRAAFVEARYEAAKAEALAIEPVERVKKCARAYREMKYREKRGEWYIFEVLARAVRKQGEHAVRVYADAKGGPDAGVVKELDDATQTVLINAYFREIDTVLPAEVPTTPVAS